MSSVLVMKICWARLSVLTENNVLVSNFNDLSIIFGSKFCSAFNEYCIIDTPNVDDGSEMQSGLAEWTGQRSVPNVFIGGKHIGGCDGITQLLPYLTIFVCCHFGEFCLTPTYPYFAATTALHGVGKLVPLLTEAGAVAKADTSGGAKASI